jgi:hypothetical protein
MSADVIQLRPIQSACRQAAKLGTNTTMAIVRRVRAEQKAGRNGFAVAGELQQARMERDSTPPPPEAA